ICLFSADGKIAVGKARIINLWHDRAFHMLHAFQAVKRRVWLQRNALNFWVQLFQAATRANERSTGTQRGYKRRNTMLALLPNFVCCSVIVSAPIGVVRVLVYVHIALEVSGGELLCLTYGAIRSFARIGVNDVSAVGVQDPLTLFGDVRRHT